MDTPYVLKKNGMYYAHNSCGYVSRVLMAELYDKAYAVSYAKRCEEVQAIPVTKLLTGVDEIQEYIDRMEVMKQAKEIQERCDHEWEICNDKRVCTYPECGLEEEI